MSSMAAMSLNEMAKAFKPDEAAGVTASINFDLSGDGGGQWNMKIADGTCVVSDGLDASADVTLHTSSEDWIAMLSGTLDDTMAFMSGRLKVDGDMGLAERMNSFFTG